MRPRRWTSWLTGVGDIEGGTIVFDLPDVGLQAASSDAIDAIPAGTARCGLVDDDLRGQPRPVDGDGDSTASCDIGSTERPTP